MIIFLVHFDFLSELTTLSSTFEGTLQITHSLLKLSQALLTFVHSHSDSIALHQCRTAHWSDSWRWSARTSPWSDRYRRRWGTGEGCRSKGFDPGRHRIDHTHWNSTSGLLNSHCRLSMPGHKVRRCLQKPSDKLWLELAMEGLQLHCGCVWNIDKIVMFVYYVINGFANINIMYYTGQSLPLLDFITRTIKFV